MQVQARNKRKGTLGAGAGKAKNHICAEENHVQEAEVWKNCSDDEFLKWKRSWIKVEWVVICLRPILYFVLLYLLTACCEPPWSALWVG